MAEPVSTAISLIIKKLAVEFINDPGKVVKYIMVAVLLPIFCIMMLFAIPSLLITSIPAILFDSGGTAEELAQQTEIIAYYKDAPDVLYQETLDWVDNKKDNYDWCDDIKTSIDFSLDWKELIAIDSVLLGQEFSNSDKNEVLNLGQKFIRRNSKTEKYKEKVTYTVKKTYTDKNGNTHTKNVKRTKWVTRTRAIITVSTRSFDSVVSEYNFSEFDIGMVNNILNTMNGTDEQGNFNNYDDIYIPDLKEYPPGNANLPYYNQKDSRWGNKSYGGSLMARAGCGPTSLAMVVSGLQNRKDIDPMIIAKWSAANGYKVPSGTAWGLFTSGGRAFGLKVEAISRKNPKKIVQALSEGYPVIASMGRGHFTKRGHFIVLRGIDENGNILVHDPASEDRSNKVWPIGLIMNESSIKGGVNGSPFWIFKM